MQLSIFTLLVLGHAIQCAGDDALIYQGDAKAGFLRIERLPNALTVPMPSHCITIETKDGVREIIRISNGDCKTIFYDLLRGSGNLEAARLVVEVSDKSHYSILLDHKSAPTAQTVAEVADKLGLEIVRDRKRKLAFVLRTNDELQTGIERFRGQPKWPEARGLKSPNVSGLDGLTYGRLVPHEIKKFSNGGILFDRWKFDDDNSVTKDNNLYFDGVSFDELAQYFEEKRGLPVVNQTKDRFLYSFSFPYDICKQFSFDKTVVIPGLGLSVMSDEVELDALVVRDKRTGQSAKKEPKVGHR